jgi:hypothetical protein
MGTVDARDGPENLLGERVGMIEAGRRAAAQALPANLGGVFHARGRRRARRILAIPAMHSPPMASSINPEGSGIVYTKP